MELRGKKVIILVEQMYNDLEFWYPYYRLKEAGTEVVVVGSGSAEEYTGKSGIPCRPDTSTGEAGKVVAAICHAGWMLASAEIVSGRTVTSFFAIKDDLVHAGANWVDEEVVVDGKLITSRKPEDLPAFMRAIITELRS